MATIAIGFVIRSNTSTKSGGSTFLFNAPVNFFISSVPLIINGPLFVTSILVPDAILLGLGATVFFRDKATKGHLATWALSASVVAFSTFIKGFSSG